MAGRHQIKEWTHRRCRSQCGLRSNPTIVLYNEAECINNAICLWYGAAPQHAQCHAPNDVLVPIAYVAQVMHIYGRRRPVVPGEDVRGAYNLT